MTMTKNCKGQEALDLSYLADYISLVEEHKYPYCAEQYQLIDYVKRMFLSEDIYIDVAQAEKYFSYEKYFPFGLFPWEKFVFVLHNCTYTASGSLRWPVLFLYVGRGTGKNGYLGFEDFCLLTPTNGIKHYNIDIFATTEDQAETTFKDVYNVLEDNRDKMQRFFYWNKEVIINLKTKSELKFRTSSPRSADGARPGKVDHDEVHAYENSKLIDVAVGGLGKVPRPRRTIMSTDGFVREGPLDKEKAKGIRILNGEIEDNGMLPFIARVDSPEEVEMPEMWYKANPSLQYLPDLLQEMKTEFQNYLDDKISNISFAVKRMNCLPQQTEGGITAFDNILATNQDITPYLSKLQGRQCTAGFDYMKTDDFLSAGLLFDVDGTDVWITHTWVCKASADLPRIKAPLQEWEAAGLLSFVDGPEIPPEIPVIWVTQKAAELNAKVAMTGIDNYRYTLLRRALKENLYASDEKGYGNIMLVRPSNEMMIMPVITSQLVNHKLAVGDNPLFRWAMNNTKVCTSSAGNMTYGKIEPKSRKTDPFKAYVAAKAAQNKIAEQISSMPMGKSVMNVFTY